MKIVHLSFPEPKLLSSNLLFWLTNSQKPKDNQFTIIEDNKKIFKMRWNQKIFGVLVKRNYIND